MPKTNWTPFIIIPLVIVVAFVIGRLTYYGLGARAAYTPPDRPLTEVSAEVAAPSQRLEAVDNPTVSKGVVVIDYDHDNALFVEELNTLLSKIVSRGFSYEVVTAADAEKKNQGLADRLRYAKALILPLPRKEFTTQEIVDIERFVERGGRLFIIGDPTRTVVVEGLNSVAGSFGIIYANDYLYSLERNDNNYRNVVYSDFRESPVTNGLDSNSNVIFYAGGSVNAPGHEIILGDDTTFSSTSEGGRNMAAAVLTTNDQVLALGDLTFFTEPYSAAENNGVLINNIADFLTGGQPHYKIIDFPNFLNASIDIVFTNPVVFNSQFEAAVKLKDFLENRDRQVNFVDTIGPENDVIFVGRFDDNLETVADYLAAAKITILEPNEVSEKEKSLAAEEGFGSSFTNVSDKPADDKERFINGRIQIDGIGDLERGGSTLFYLNQEDSRNVLIILSDTRDTNEDAFKLLLDNKLSECQATPQIAVCQTEDPDEKLPPSQRSNRIDKVLVISDNDARERKDAQTSALAYQSALSNTYKVDILTTSEDGSPNLDKLLEYDAVIWSTGNYWDDSIDEADVELLTEYKRVGGNLIIEGASIAFDWDHTDFLSDVVHADYLGFAEQKDIELALSDHPIADDFEEGAVISFTVKTSTDENEEILPVDVVRHTPDSRVIFQRGPESEGKGAPSAIAYEDDRVKIAYFAFPVYLVASEESRDLLISNTVDWFTKKALDLPDLDDYEPFEGDGFGKKEQSEPSGEEPPAEGEGNGGQGNGDSGEDQGSNNEEGNEGENSNEGQN